MRQPPHDTNDIKSLSAEHAETLAKHTGGLHPEGLTTLSDKAAAVLRSNPEVTLPEPRTARRSPPPPHASGDLSGISELFGLRHGQEKMGSFTDTVGRWVAATEGSTESVAVSGRLVHGPYRLIAELGTGVTYRAWDTQVGIPVVVMGTPEYMAPELFNPRAKLAGSVDQYALAVTVYEMLSGEKPFTGSTAHIIVEHSSLPVPSLERKRPGLPRTVCEAVHRGLAKKPDERFRSCGEFAAAVVAGVTPFTPEADTVRLLCPSCKNILKLPRKAAGKTGKCTRCQTAMDVAEDLGSLWLESEERGQSLHAASVPAAVEGLPPQPIGPTDASDTRTWQPMHIAAVLVAAIVGFISGLAIILASPLLDGLKALSR